MKDIEDKLAAFLMDYGVLKNADAEKMAKRIAGMFEKEREELAQKLERISSHVRCMYCNKEYSFEESDQLADHIMSCEKSPVVDMVHKMEHRIMDYMDMMNDEFQRILAITDNQEIIGICERARQVIAQKEPVIKQRDDALDKLKLSEAQVVQLLDENTSLKLDWSHSEAENAQLAAKCAELKELIRIAFEDCSTIDTTQNGCYEVSADAMLNLFQRSRSDDCGTGWLSPENAAKMRAMLQEVYEWCVTDNPSDIDGDTVKRVLDETK